MSAIAGRSARIAVIGLGVAAILLTLPGLASATFPGKNGKIAFNSGGASIYAPGTTIEVINPDGTGRATLTTGAYPAWSPDGQRIAFIRGRSLYVAAADGTNATEIFVESKLTLSDPAWSPDGTQIAFVRYGDCNNTSGDCDSNELLIVNADGTGVHPLIVQSAPGTWPVPGASVEEPSWSPDGTQFVGGDDIRYGDTPRVFIVDVDGTDFRYLTGGYDSNMASWSPSWSPDGSRIAFSRVDYHCCGQGATQRVLSIRPNGTNQVQLWPGFSSFPPAWAPDGSRVLLSVCAGNPCENDLVLVDPNGGNPVQLTDDAGFQGHPDWQPIPVNSYPRPRAATLHQASLVPAYNVCGYPNHTHGPPLAFGSCNPPVQASHETTLGTPDSNGKPLKGEGKASYTTAANDVRITVEVADVYNRASLTDYTGELRLRSSLRITDKRNTSPVGGPTAATVSDTTVAATVPCTATGDPNQGASCLLSTTANAIAPGTVASGARTVWELGQTQVDDGGADGDADTAGDNARFMVQGVFVP